MHCRRQVEKRRIAALGAVTGLFLVFILIATSHGLWTFSHGSSSADDNNASDHVAGIIEPLAVDHAVWGYVTDLGGNPVPDSTVVNLTVFHVDHYTTYNTSGTSGGWYSYVLSYAEQGTNWDAEDNIWVNVTHIGLVYVNQTTITSTSNQQIDVYCDVPIPEFPGLIVPMLGTIGILLLVRGRRAKL